MSIGIVYGLEAVEVNAEDGELKPLLIGFSDRLLKYSGGISSVIKSRQQILLLKDLFVKGTVLKG
jgi:hypothetical protein